MIGGAFSGGGDSCRGGTTSPLTQGRTAIAGCAAAEDLITRNGSTRQPKRVAAAGPQPGKCCGRMAGVPQYTWLGAHHWGLLWQGTGVVADDGEKFCGVVRGEQNRAQESERKQSPEEGPAGTP